MDCGSSYYDKVFRDPSYIWHEGFCDLPLIESTLETYHVDRLLWLESPGSVRAEVLVKPGKEELPESSSSHGTLSNDTERPTQVDSLAKDSASRNVVMPLLSLVWNGAEPQNYQCQFRIGTDPVPFLLDLDTGSSLLWVQSHLESSDPTIHDQSQYDPKTSKTSRNTGQTQTVNYGDGSNVHASLYTDDVRIGAFLAQSQYIGAVSSRNLSQSAVAGKSNGLIGLGFARVEAQGFVQTLQKQGAIKYASITLVGPRNDPKQAAQIDVTKNLAPRGYLIVGSVDSKFYTGEIAWCPQVPNFDTAVSDRWIVKLDAVLLDGVPIEGLQNQYALIDTGTSYIVTSPSNMTTFRRRVGAGARPTQKEYMWAYPRGAIESISFRLGGRTIELHPSDFSLGDLKPDSQGVTRTLSSICTLPNGSWPFADNLWVLGGIFIDNVVTIFDFGARKIGFADISERDLDRDVATP